GKRKRAMTAMMPPSKATSANGPAAFRISTRSTERKTTVIHAVERLNGPNPVIMADCTSAIPQRFSPVCIPIKRQPCQEPGAHCKIVSKVCVVDQPVNQRRGKGNYRRVGDRCGRA